MSETLKLKLAEISACKYPTAGFEIAEATYQTATHADRLKLRKILDANDPIPVARRMLAEMTEETEPAPETGDAVEYKDPETGTVHEWPVTDTTETTVEVEIETGEIVTIPRPLLNNTTLVKK